jgi:hypothetical protein
MPRGISMGGLFSLLERLTMKFPKATGGLDDKVRFDEKVNFILTTVNNKEVRGNN